jgi:E3 ubiquitin-protein ligase SHPRH
VEERVLDVSSRKRLGSLQKSSVEDSSTIVNPSLRYQLDQSEAEGLQQHLGKLLERRGVGEVVETGEIWKCLFGNAEDNNVRLQVLKEVQRDQRAAAAEARMTTMIVQ